jgi:hypothetical protein
MGRGFVAPSDKLIVAGIGVGGKGTSDLDNFFASGKAEIAVLCDVDDRQAAPMQKKYPKAKRYKDFREMLSKEGKSMTHALFPHQIIHTQWLQWLPCN